MKQPPKSLPVLKRSYELDRSALNETERTIDLSFSSETPVDRWFGQEILSHEKGAMRMDRLKNGAALLLNHDSDRYIGVVEKASVDSKDKMGRATVRFGKSPLADQVLNDVRDGILRNVSVGYIINRLELVSSSDKEGDVYRATDWTPVEISMVPVPADPSVGVGRAAEAGAKEFPVQFDQPVEATREIETAAAVISQEGKPVMKTVEEVREISKAEGLRVQEINDLASKYSSVLPREKVAEFVSKDTTVGEVRKFIMDAQIADAQKNAVRNVNVADLSDEEKQNYSFVRAINQAGEEEKPGFETEVSKAIGKALGRESSRHSIFVPVNVPMLLSKREAEMQKRAGLATTSAGVGGNVVFTSMDSFIDFLYNRMKVMSLGATKLSGLRDTVAFPARRRSAPQRGWLRTRAPTSATPTPASTRSPSRPRCCRLPPATAASCSRKPRSMWKLSSATTWQCATRWPSTSRPSTGLAPRTSPRAS
jgi:HK97 family phage prohead protease